MANTRSAQKAVRQSAKRRLNNLKWKKDIKAVAKNLSHMLETKKPDVAILNKEMTALQKVLDKAAKAQVIHKNKAARIKSTYARKISAQTSKDGAKAK